VSTGRGDLGRDTGGRTGEIRDFWDHANRLKYIRYASTTEKF